MCLFMGFRSDLNNVPLNLAFNKNVTKIINRSNNKKERIKNILFN